MPHLIVSELIIFGRVSLIEGGEHINEFLIVELSVVVGIVLIEDGV